MTSMVRVLVISALSYTIGGMPMSAEEMSFDIIYGNHTNIVVADGEIKYETPDRFQDFLDQDPFDGFNFEIHLNSPGGSLFGGIKLGEMIRQNKLSTNVWQYDPRKKGEEFYLPAGRPGSCYSACSLAFLGGEVRSVADGSIIGFHQFSGSTGSAPAAESSAQLAAGEVLEYIIRTGASPQLFKRMTEALPNDMFIPNGQELIELGIISKDSFNGFSLEPHGEGIVASATFPENTKGDNLVYQISTYCKGGQPYLLLIGPPDFRGLDENFIGNASQYLDGFSMWTEGVKGLTVSYPRDHVEFRTEGRPLAEIRIDDKAIALISSGRVHGAVQYPHAMGGMMYFEITATSSDLKNMAAAHKLCVS
jgi:hypothetical protein